MQLLTQVSQLSLYCRPQRIPPVFAGNARLFFVGTQVSQLSKSATSRRASIVWPSVLCFTGLFPGFGAAIFSAPRIMYGVLNFSTALYSCPALHCNAFRLICRPTLLYAVLLAPFRVLPRPVSRRVKPCTLCRYLHSRYAMLCQCIGRLARPRPAFYVSPPTS